MCPVCTRDTIEVRVRDRDSDMRRVLDEVRLRVRLLVGPFGRVLANIFRFGALKL